MTPRLWFFPCWSGDFRLEAIADEKCRLTVEDPTPADRRLLTPFVVKLRREGVLSNNDIIRPKGRTKIDIDASMGKLGPRLAHALNGEAETWTVIRHANGRMSLESLALVTVGPEAEPTQEAQDAVFREEPESNQKPVAAATVRRPARGCPAPTPCERRASEVLRTFCTRRQWQQWQRQGRLTAIGNATGKAYHVHHRNTAARLGLGHSLTEVGTGHEVCVWDDRVPPEEEALSIKLAVEHRERWMLDLRRL